MNDCKFGPNIAYRFEERSKNEQDYPVLNNDIRRNTFLEILQNPGIHNRELQRRLGVSNGTMAWHIRILKESRMVKSIKGNYYNSYYPSNDFQKYPPCEFIQNRTRRKILECIRAIKGITQKEISEKIERDQSTVIHHLRKLIRANSILEVKDGKCLRYFVV